jgi:hypothetical protein
LREAIEATETLAVFEKWIEKLIKGILISIAKVLLVLFMIDKQNVEVLSV